VSLICVRKCFRVVCIINVESFITLQVVCDICGRILDLCGATTQFPWRNTNIVTALVTNGNTSSKMLKELCKSLSELELRAYLGGVDSDHVIQNDEDDNEELDMLVSPSSSVHDTLKCSDLINSNKTTTQSLNKIHLGNWLDDKDTVDTAYQLKVRLYELFLICSYRSASNVPSCIIEFSWTYSTTSSRGIKSCVRLGS